MSTAEQYIKQGLLETLAKGLAVRTWINAHDTALGLQPGLRCIDCELQAPTPCRPQLRSRASCRCAFDECSYGCTQLPSS